MRAERAWIRTLTVYAALLTTMGGSSATSRMRSGGMSTEIRGRPYPRPWRGSNRFLSKCAKPGKGQEDFEMRKGRIMEQQKRIVHRLNAEKSRSNGSMNSNLDFSTENRESHGGLTPTDMKKRIQALPDEASDDEMQLATFGFVIYQSLTEVSVNFMVPEDIRPKDVKVEFTTSRMRCTLQGASKPLFDGELYGAIEARESIWELEQTKEGKRLVITLIKNPTGIWDQFEDNNPKSKFNTPQEQVIRRLRSDINFLDNNLQDARNRMIQYGKDLIKRDEQMEEMMLKSQEITAIRNATVIKPLALGVVDTLESVNEENIDSKSILAGVLMRLKQILLDSGVEKLPCNPGDAYDPRWHVAVDWLKSGDAQSQSKNANSTGIIEQVIRDGYSVDGVLMRKAEVKVFKSS